MISYIIGKIIAQNKKSITIENNYIGYNVLVSNVEKYEIGKIKKIYIYKSLLISSSKNKVIEELYGFDNYEEKEMFCKLLMVQGIGNKTAISICANDLTLLKSLIVDKDENSLASLKSITPKIARSLVDELDFGENYKVNNCNQTADLIKALKTLGYGNKEIESAVNNIDTNKSDLSDLISDAIKYISSSSWQPN
ncbi:MAG: Holliday junction branch migration protein RuvA [Mycoplasmoidaceae bacterium]|nr:MAG: Holliday junction branch migration protein RuvA [Mycoplasmoidaceae bacterium]